MKDIVLTGPKHSGKTSAGKALALFRSGDFIDLDELISRRTGKSPRRLFNENPEIFKKAEVEAMADSAGSGSRAGQKQRVIAAGGGLTDNQEAVNILKNSGATVVYLNISAACAWNRIANSPDRELPPFLRTENPRETHRVLHERRAAACARIADIVIEAENKSPEEIAAEIQRNEERQEK
jgi:shikimate kinase